VDGVSLKDVYITIVAGSATALFTYMMAPIMIVVPFFILMRGLCIGLYPELPADSVAVAARARHGAGGARRFDDKRRD
jgi:hypothetical protein